MLRKLRLLYLAVILDARFIALRRRLFKLGRQLTLKRRVVHVFLQIDDPYSYLLSHYLEFVRQRFKLVSFRYHLCQALRGDFVPQPALLAKHALKDCRMLAAELGVPFLDKGPEPLEKYRRPLLDFLADEHEDEDFPQTFTHALRAYWRGDTDDVLRLIGQATPDQAATNVLVGKNQLLLRKMGHYNCATMCDAGEWYWGVDRLLYLMDRFAEQGLDRYKEPTPELAALKESMRIRLPAARPRQAASLPPLEMFYSFRSPYAYLALKRVFEIADAFGLKLRVRPVLPMAMRGYSIPKSKLLYIVQDANREAKALGYPFGRIADAFGIGAERCMAVLAYAESQGRSRRFLAAAGEGIWARAIDVSTDDGMRAVTDRAGLEWSGVQAALQDDAWRARAEENREALTALGLWGVPSFHIGDLSVWGQDRLWLLARRIDDMCGDARGAGE